MPIILNNITNPEDVVAINNNFDKIEQAWDEKLDRFVSLQGNEMDQDMDMNGKAILNVHVNNESRSLVNKEYVDNKIHSYEADVSAQVVLAKQYAEESLASSVSSNASAVLSSQEAGKAKLAAETAAVDTGNALRGEFVQLKEAADASAVRAEVAANNAATMTAAQLNSKFTMLADNAYDSANRAEHQVSLARLQALRAEDAADKAAVEAAADVRTQFEGLVGQATTQAERAQTEANRATIAANTAAGDTANALRGEFTAITERAETAATSASSNSSSAMLAATAAKLSEEAATRSKVDSEKYRNDAALSASQALTYSQVASSSAVLAGQEASRAAKKAAEELTKTTAGYLSGFVTDASTQADRAKAEADRASQITGLDTVEEAIDNALARDGLTAMTKEDFFALAEKRKRDSAGSGFLEWGKYTEYTTKYPNVNEGMWTVTSDPSFNNTIRLGRAVDPSGTSRTDYPRALVSGVQHNIDVGNLSTDVSILFPSAPNGTKTYDSKTGVVVQHASVEEAFAAETETNKVITTRKDLCFLEAWYEAIDLHDLWNPLGNVQFGASSFDGITGLSNTLVAQGYSAFGEWDTKTKGYGKRWSSMTLAEKTIAIQNPDNNIYFDAATGKYIQVKYRIRVEEGVDSLSTVVQRMTKLGYTRDSVDVGKWTNPNGNTAIGVCLVQRLNQGAYHPVYNSEGCGLFWSGGGRRWFQGDYAQSTRQCFIDPPRWSNSGNLHSDRSGRPTTDPYQYYDAIYAGQVEDLRLSANKQDYSRLLEDSIRKAVAGETRGKGRVVFLKAILATGTKTVGVGGKGQFAFEKSKVLINPSFLEIGAIEGLVTVDGKSYNVVNVGAVSGAYVSITTDGNNDGSPSGLTISGSFWEKLTPEYDILPWVDIIGSPENIAATFPNGVVGQWIPQQGVSSSWSLNRKSTTGSAEVVKTSDNGATWTVSTPTIDGVLNDVKIALDTSTEVTLVPYSSLSNFTAPANNSVVVGSLGNVVISGNHDIQLGNRLQPSLIGLVNTSKTTWGRDDKVGGQVLLQDYVIAEGLINNYHALPTHNPIKISAPQNNSPAVKALYNLTSKDGLLYIQYHGNELKYKADAEVGKDKWGDTTPATPLSSPYGTIPIINGEGTMTNLNGEVVKTFCHTEMIPIGIADFTEAATATTREVNFFSLVNVPTEMMVHYVEDEEGTLTRLPFYFENGGHIDDAEVARYELFQEQHEAYIQANYEEYESRTPEILV